jgi:hypothetical protein
MQEWCLLFFPVTLRVKTCENSDRQSSEWFVKWLPAESFTLALMLIYFLFFSITVVYK